jgi:hypothetical protein
LASSTTCSVSDNDLFAGGSAFETDTLHLGNGLPTHLFAFAIDEQGAGIHVVPQNLSGPLFPPGRVKKIVGK